MSPSVGRSYCALRATRNASSTVWWATAQHQPEVPPAIDALLAGRSRVEVSPAEAEAALAWASTLSGWAEVTPKPVFVYRPGFASA